MKQSIREEFSQYADFGELLHHEDEMNQYMNEFLKKEINVLLNQFYKKFWQIEENTLNLLAKTIYGLLQKVNLDVYYQLAGHHAELDFDHLYGSYDEAREGLQGGCSPLWTSGTKGRILSLLEVLICPDFNSCFDLCSFRYENDDGYR